jgi:hypothetical protein
MEMDALAVQSEAFESFGDFVKILFTGGRDFTNKAAVERLFNALFDCADEPFFPKVIVGDARGLDNIVREISNERGYEVEVFKANWEAEGRVAGFNRNQRMVDTKPDLCIASPGGRGTQDCVDRCHKAGIPVLRLEP